MNDWEALCRRCGQCCFEKWVDEDGLIHPTAIPCRFLDIISRECKVYGKRFEVGEGCIKLTPEVVEVVQWLPHDCGYRRQGETPRETGQMERTRRPKGRGKQHIPNRRSR